MTFNKAAEKMNKGELLLEDILDDDDLVLDVKTNPNCQLAPFFTNEIIKKLIDYANTMPKLDDHKHGHKFPFNACEILCSENGFILDRLVECIKLEKEENEEENRKRKESHYSDNYKDDHSEEESDGSDNKVENNINENDPCAKKDLPTGESEFEEKIVELDYHTYINSLNSEKNLQGIEEKMQNMKIENEAERGESKEHPYTTPHSPPNDEKKENENSGIKNQSSIDTKVVQENNQNDVQMVYEDGNESNECDANDLNEYEKNDSHENRLNELKKKGNQDQEDPPKEDDDDFFEISQENVKVSLKKEKEEQMGEYEMLDYFYNFLNSGEEEINFVLAGYFSKIFSHLMNQKSQVIVKYIFFHKPQLLNLFIVHCNRKAISECLYRILISTTDDLKNGNDLKVSLLENILTRLLEDSDLEKAENISDLLIECLNNRKFYFIFMSNIKLLSILHDITIKYLKDSAFLKEILKILIKINENIIKDFGNNVTPVFNNDSTNDIFNFNQDPNINIEDENINLTKLGESFNIKNHLEAIFEILAKITLCLINEFVLRERKHVVDTTYDKNTTVLGLKKLYQFEYFKTIFDILINGYAANLFVEKLNNIVDIIKGTRFFTIALDYFYEFEFNNVYQKLFEQLIIILTNKHSPQILVNHVFDYKLYDNNNIKFFDSIMLNCDENLKFNFNSGKQINSGFLASMCEISHHVLQSENTFIKEIISKNERLSKFFKVFTEPIRNRFNQGLLYNPNSSRLLSYDRLISSDYDSNNEHITKEAENVGPSVPLSEIIRTCLEEFDKIEEELEESKEELEDNEKKEYKGYESMDIYDRYYELNRNMMEAFQQRDYEPELQHSANEDSDSNPSTSKDIINNNEQIFKIRDNSTNGDHTTINAGYEDNQPVHLNKDKNKKSDESNIHAQTQNLIENNNFYDNVYWKPTSYLDDTLVDAPKSTENNSFYDNLYWKATNYLSDDILKDI